MCFCISVCLHALVHISNIHSHPHGYSCCSSSPKDNLYLNEVNDPFRHFKLTTKSKDFRQFASAIASTGQAVDIRETHEMKITYVTHCHCLQVHYSMIIQLQHVHVHISTYIMMNANTVENMFVLCSRSTQFMAADIYWLMLTHACIYIHMHTCR